MQEPLPISLDAYLNESGAACGFSVGEEIAFALEFSAPNPLRSARSGRRSLTNIGGAQYSAVGRSVYSFRHWWVVDFGVPAYARHWPEAPRPKPGKVFEGDIFLAMDAGDYSNNLSLFPSSPPLVFDWRIERIEALMGPLTELRSGYFWRDPKRSVRRELTKVPAAGDGAGYIIHCVRLSQEPRHSSRA